MKKILRYTGWLAGIILLLSGGILLWIFLKYQIAVNAESRKELTSFSPGEYGQWVDPFIGTGGFPAYTSGDVIPGATLPFGMVRLSPDTRFFLGKNFFDETTVSTAGYYYADRHIMGFSHTRLIGTGAWDGGHFRVYPSTGEHAVEKYLKGRYHKFSHHDEKAFPGYYAVQFDRPGIQAELTATERTGIHRYTFTGNDDPVILIDVASALGKGRTCEGEVTIYAESREITGCIRTFGSFASRYGGIKVYFAAQVSQPFLSSGTWSGREIFPGKTHLQGDTIGAFIRFSNNGKEKQVELRLALSYVSIDNARENLKAEAAQLSFSELVDQAVDAWEKKLSRIAVSGSTEDQRRIFYSSLYRAFQMPTVFQDVNGEYMGFDKQVHRADSFRYYTDMSLWDTYRTVHPLYNLLAREEQRDMVVSLVKMAEQGGLLPRWPSGYGYTGSMFGSPADMVIAESYLKGIRDFDVEKAYAYMKKGALGTEIPDQGFRSRRNIREYLEYTWCPADLMGEAVSKTLEYAWADDAISRLAGELGKVEDEELFRRHSKYYRNVWNPETRYFHPRNASGEFSDKFDPLLLTYFDRDGEITDDYVEGCANQWRWNPFFDPEGLLELFGDTAYFVGELNSFFKKSNPRRGHWNPGSYYWHGNEPDIHAAYLFNTADEPGLTQKWVRWILENKYGSGYDGLDGDDDAGTLSAWYVFSALGFYPVAGTDIYQIGIPMFRETVLRSITGNLHIVAEGLSPEKPFIQQVLLNNRLLDRRWFSHDEIAEGGELRFVMGGE